MAVTATQYKPTDYSDLYKKANQQPKTYQAYDYSKLINRANQAPQTYTKQNYNRSMSLADRARQVTAPSNTVNYSNVLNQINTAKTTQSTPTFQNSQLVSQLTGDILKNLAPVRNTQEARINSQYNTSRRALQEALAQQGLNRSGGGVDQLIKLEQARNAALAEANANLIQGALAQALPFGQLALSERGLLQSQQSNAANQLANLLAQQTAHQQWANQYNAEQAQRQFENVFNVQRAGAEEGRFAADFAAQEAQRQFENLMGANQLAAGENRYGQQFNADQAQQQLANLLAISQAQADENRYAADLALRRELAMLPYEQMTAAQQAEIDLARRQLDADIALQEAGLTGKYQGQDTLAAQQLAQQQAINEAELTGKYNGQDTLVAQQLAANIANQQFQQKLAEGELTGTYGGQQTLAAQQLAQQQAATNTQSSLDLLKTLLNYNIGVGETTEDLPVVEGFNYGDAMIKLLKDLGYL